MVWAKRRYCQWRHIYPHTLVVRWNMLISNIAIRETETSSLCTEYYKQPCLYTFHLMPLSHMPRCAGPISNCFPLAHLPFDFCYSSSNRASVWLVWLCETVPPAWGSCEYKQNRCTLGSGITLPGWGSCDQAYYVCTNICSPQNTENVWCTQPGCSWQGFGVLLRMLWKITSRPTTSSKKALIKSNSGRISLGNE